ncbi:MAG: hypothetical protein D6816_13540 [Bacteroidetes bacterium]|nr:MAG: hypothetical protein D6816_13540 [Bacteroidota bacterium]
MLRCSSLEVQGIFRTSPFLKFLIILFFFASGNELAAQYQELESIRQMATTGQHGQADAQLQQLLEQHPDFLPAQLLQAHNNAWAQKFELAQQQFRTILTIHPGNKEALIGLGYAYAWNGELSKAIYPFSTVLRSDPKNEEALTGLGVAYLQANNGAAALHHYKILTKTYPDKAAHYLGLARSYAMLAQNYQARKALDKALKLDPGNAEARDLAGRISTEKAGVEIDLISGFSNVDEEQRLGLRMAQLSFHYDERWTFYGRYDNSLSQDNIDFLRQKTRAASGWAGAFAVWSPKLATRLEYGLRSLPGRSLQNMLKVEQVIFLPRGYSLKVGGFTTLEKGNEWLTSTGVYIPVGKRFSLEPTWFYSRNATDGVGQHRFLLASKLRLPKGYEVSAGGFYGNHNFQTELLPGMNRKIIGAYLMGVLPVSERFWGLLVVNHERGVFNTSTVLAAGIKIRLEE